MCLSSLSSFQRIQSTYTQTTTPLPCRHFTIVSYGLQIPFTRCSELYRGRIQRIVRLWRFTMFTIRIRYQLNIEHILLTISSALRNFFDWYPPMDFTSAANSTALVIFYLPSSALWQHIIPMSSIINFLLILPLLWFLFLHSADELIHVQDTLIMPFPRSIGNLFSWGPVATDQYYHRETRLGLGRWPPFV